VATTMPVPGAVIYKDAESRNPLSTVGPAPCASTVSTEQTSRNTSIRKFRTNTKDGRAKRRIRRTTASSVAQGSSLVKQEGAGRQSYGPVIQSEAVRGAQRPPLRSRSIPPATVAQFN